MKILNVLSAVLALLFLVAPGSTHMPINFKDQCDWASGTCHVFECPKENYVTIGNCASDVKCCLFIRFFIECIDVRYTQWLPAICGEEDNTMAFTLSKITGTDGSWTRMSLQFASRSFVIAHYGSQHPLFSKSLAITVTATLAALARRSTRERCCCCHHHRH